MSTPYTKPAPTECIWIPEGADHRPSGRRDMRIPEPVDPETWNPTRPVVMMARPTALEITRGGIVRRVRVLDLDFGAWPSTGGAWCSASVWTPSSAKITCVSSVLPAAGREGGQGNSLQKLLRMRAAFSHSLSMVVGRNDSEPILFANMFSGAVAFPPSCERRSDQPGLVDSLGAFCCCGGNGDGGWLETGVASSYRLDSDIEDV